MKPDWFVSPQALSRARLDQLLSQEQLAKKSGVSVRSIRSYERKEQAIRQETLQCLAKALSRDARDLGIVRVKETNGSPRTAPRSEPPPAPATQPPANPTPPVSALPPRTQLETMIDLERASGVETGPIDTPTGPLERLTAKRLQDVFTTYALHDGARFCLTGKVDSMRGIPPAEAKLIGGRTGAASRFHILKEVAPGRPVGVTVHAAKDEHAAALQKAFGADVTLHLRVVVVPGEPREDGPGFSSFITKSTGRRPWTFLVEEVAGEAGVGEPGKREKRKAKTATRGR